MDGISKKTIVVLLFLAMVVSVIGTLAVLKSMEGLDLPEAKQPKVVTETTGKGMVNLYVGEKPPGKVFEAQGLVTLNVGE